ncbi:MAG: GH1 family beta-glucosidase [Sphaerochaetaceae bacterium]
MDKNFYWGVATSSYQIEGNSGKKGKDIWDEFCNQENKIIDSSSGKIACDHINRYKEDITLMKKLGITSYRFSISWSRIFPNGEKEINEEGVLFYHNLIDCLIENKITPFITVFHWDLPYALHLKGGWLNSDCVKWFSDYCAFVSKEYSDKVKYFITMNEPQCFAVLGYQTGDFAPGLKVSLSEQFQIIHNILLSHGSGVRALRENAKQGLCIGYAPTAEVAIPETDSKEDIESARKCYFDCQEVSNPKFLWNVSIFSDPIFLGDYPEKYYINYKNYLPKITKEALNLISTPIDFLGQNIYNGYPVSSDGKGGYKYGQRKQGYDHTDMGWPITPSSLYWGPKFLYERYKKPIIITENGMANADIVSQDGKIHDSNRIEFLNRYIGELLRAKKDNVDIRGYFLWSLLDNFEWNSGYSKRFGIVHVDYENQKRTIKDSGYWYQDFIKNNLIIH